MQTLTSPTPMDATARSPEDAKITCLGQYVFSPFWQCSVARAMIQPRSSAVRSENRGNLCLKQCLRFAVNSIAPSTRTEEEARRPLQL